MSDAATPKSELLEMQRTFVQRCAKGEFVEVMEDYYADDAYQIEGDGSRREGKANMIAFEKQFLTQVKQFHGIDLGSIAVASDDGKGNGVTMAEYTIKADMIDGSKFWPEQVQVSTWKNGKIIAVRFYYDPNF
ncbi:hypothetical protein Poly24_46100 [Rosistilla carotiformis]|uniref:SnoaL-like domain protein n=1 Tax=Rosistilla carotiformis TaxID=2528017 RepID=A0A518JZ99_9BACT|nr:SnoaL-like domain-containing protein [Rosistilla carotiformis]QDV70877.1 hypothetical protein Poly24_46100 [Rosistilla carotiformis]